MRPASAEARRPGRIGWLALTASVAAALSVAACGSSSSGPGGAAIAHRPGAAGAVPSRSALATTMISGDTVLTNARGFTLYSFALDTGTSSQCDGQCARLWPPLEGPVTAVAGITGKLGTITRSGGTVQATYNGHPLYTYVADTAPGQAKGNGLNASGGVWHEITVPAPSPSAGGGLFDVGRR